MENVEEHSKLQICNLYRKLQNHKIYFCDRQCESEFHQHKHYSTGSGSGSPVAGIEDKSGLTILLYSAKVLTGPSGVLSQPGLSIVSSKMPINGLPSGVISLN